MKKLITFLFLAPLLLLASCSSDSDDEYEYATAVVGRWAPEQVVADIIIEGTNSEDAQAHYRALLEKKYIRYTYLFEKAGIASLSIADPASKEPIVYSGTYKISNASMVLMLDMVNYVKTENLTLHKVGDKLALSGFDELTWLIQDMGERYPQHTLKKANILLSCKSVKGFAEL